MCVCVCACCTHTHIVLRAHMHTHIHNERARTLTNAHTGEIELTGLPEEGGEDAIRQALADLLGVDISQIVLPEQARRQQRRAVARKFVFEIVGDTAKAAELAADLKTGNLAARLSSQLSQTYNMNISAQVSSGDVAETAEKRPEGEEWEEVDGQYLLRKCPQGFLLVNTTVELSMCRECDAGTFSFRDSDGCNEKVHPAVCNTRECTPCPVGATCAKGSDEASRHFIPKALKVFCSLLPPLPVWVRAQRADSDSCCRLGTECMPWRYCAGMTIASPDSFATSRHKRAPRSTCHCQRMPRQRRRTTTAMCGSM